MANILLSTRCNRTCPYCFARDEMGNTRSETFMSWENLIYLADLHETSGQTNISLLGGEPTLHPQFVDFVAYLLRRNFNVTVFTNGILSKTRLLQCEHSLTKYDTDRLSFVCNINDPDQTPAPADHGRKIEEFLSLMGPRTLPGFNIYRLDFRLEFLFDSINRFGMKRHMRLGITHPVPGSTEGFIRPVDIRTAIERLYGYRPLFD
ncbi:MAG: radical SAM protein [Syntrophorhabdus sp.]